MVAPLYLRFVCILAPIFLALLAGTLPLSAQAPAAIVFEDITESAGLRDPIAGLMGHGGAAGDFDGDGKIDLFVGGFADRPDAEYAPASGPLSNKLFRNMGRGRFRVEESPVSQTYARTSGAVFADLDNNGTLELYVANNAKGKSSRADEPQRTAQVQRSQLFRNDGCRFIDISAESGACPETLRTARNVGVLDYDGDGLLDLFVVEDKFTKNPRSALFRNLGGLKFQDVTEAVGLPPDIYGLGLAVGDLNGDDQPDLFIGHSNRLFLSQPGNRYQEAAELTALFQQEPLDGEDWPCGAALVDVNRDGRLDLFISAHASRARNRLFLQEKLENGRPRLREITREAGLADIVPAKCPHVEVQDFDNDGWPDIYLSAGWLEEGAFTPLIFRHTGLHDGTPRFAPPRLIQPPMVYFPAGPTCDIDGDGRLDLFLVNWFAGNHTRLLRNTALAKKWLNVSVVGRTINRMGIGAQVQVFRPGEMGLPGALLSYQEIGTGYGYASGQPAVAHFGLCTLDKVDVRVRLPGGKTIEKMGVPADQQLTIDEP